MTGSWPARRFWSVAEVAETEDGFTILLDARAIKTPAKTPLVVPTRLLGIEIAHEWSSVEETIEPDRMPLTRAANSALDRVAPAGAEVATIVADYGRFDLVCYRADTPDTLAARQSDAWDPLIAWSAEALGAPLLKQVGLTPIEQPAQSIRQLASLVHDLDPFRLTALHDLVALSGSLVIGLAVTQGHLDPETAWTCSRIDEDFQIEQWGEDEEATIAASEKAAAFAQAARLWNLLED